MTNLCYLAGGFHREIADSTHRHSAGKLSGQMAGGALIMVFMGASSFAFHRKAEMWSPAHTLDITFGFLMAFHVMYNCFSVVVIALAKYCLPDRLDGLGAAVVRTMASAGFVLGVTLIMVFYDEVYGNQLQFYFTVGPVAAVFGGIARFIIVREEKKVHWGAVGIAAIEVVVVLTAVFSAVFSQTNLLGRKIGRDTELEAYELYHGGGWHFQLALAFSMLYSRSADAARVIRGTHKVCVCSLPVLDWAGEAIVFVYSVTCLVLKEMSVDTNTAIIVLGSLSSLFLVHAVATALALAFGGRLGPLAHPTPLSRSGFLPLRTSRVP